MNKKFGFILGGVGLAIGAYAYYLKKQSDKLKSLDYRIQNIRFNNLGLTNVKITADIVINNPSNVKFTVNSYNINVVYQGKNIANISKSNINTILFPNGVATLPVEVQLDPLQVGENILSLLISNISVGQGQQTKSGLKFVGKISGKFGLFGFKNIPVDYSF